MACLFCRIASGEIPADLVYSGDRIVAFRDINPQAPTHILVIPREHIPTVNDVTAEHRSVIGEIVEVARDLAAENGLAERGYRLVWNTNAEAGQSVFHVHLHLLGGRSLGWPPG